MIFEGENESVLKVIPLGGLGEMGLNMMLLEYEEQIIIIDCGFMFPDTKLPGVDLVIPDMTYVIERADNVKAIILTHGHEDHTGGLPFLLDHIQVPIYGTRLTLALLEEKLKERHVGETFEMIPVSPRQTVSIGPIDIEFIRVSHSIVDGVGLAISTPVGVILHTGDFKMDPTPVDGEVIDLHRFSSYGEKGVLALLSDSTNVECEGITMSETEVSKMLDSIVSEAEGRVKPRGKSAAISYNLTQNDMKGLRKGLKILSEIMVAAGAEAVLPGIYGLPERLTKDEIGKLDDAPLDPRNYTMVATHLFGTCRMGPDPKKSVVGLDFQVHDTRGVYVLDSSFFPTSLGVNPQHTIMGLASAGAKRIAAS